MHDFQLVPGDRFSEAELGTRLGVSRTPVREAQFRLRNEGFLDLESKAGWCVRPPVLRHSSCSSPRRYTDGPTGNATSRALAPFLQTTGEPGTEIIAAVHARAQSRASVAARRRIRHAERTALRMVELEIKLCVPEAVLPSLRQALQARGARRTRLRAHYFDTADGALARHHVALRLRLEGRRWVQTLKAAGNSAVHRLEHEVQVPGPAGQRPALDPRRHDGSAAAPALAAALQAAADATLLEQHATDIWRLHCPMWDAAGTCIEAALDIGQVLAEGRSAPVAELELELKAGSAQGLFKLAAACVRHGGLWQSTVTKAERGQRLRTAVPPAQATKSTKARPPRLAAGRNGPSLMRALLLSALEQVLGNASEVAAQADAGEAVHQLRVGLRRLRVVLRELAPLSTAIAPSWDAALSTTFAQLGEWRDQDAVAAAVRPLLEAAQAPVTHWHAEVLADPGTAVRDAAFQSVLLEIQALAHADDAAFAPMSAAAARAFVAARLQRLHRRVLRAGRHFEQLPVAAQHRVRKQLKRLRYLSEFTLALWPGRDPKAFRRALALAQEALGLHQDVAVAAAAFRREALTCPEAGFAAGYLQAHLAVTALAARRALRALRGQRVCWR